ncbi:hypothetical protein ACW9S2_003710 [Klebsiella michiganensis]
MTDTTELALIAKIKKQLENFDTVVLKEAEAKALVEALEKAQQERDNWRTSFDNERFRADKLAATLSDEIEQAANVRGQLLIAHRTLLNQQAKISEQEDAEQKLCAANVTLDARAELAERQLAGLESRLESADKLQDSAFRSGLQQGFSLGQTDDQKGYEQSMAAYSPSGVIKVGADSLDADVSNRNQPGMVVAVHIDVGDFVKFRGQVYEVKETDFDDHDVTLWFVCGEVLKCAAGCQIEVVSATVEDE